MKQLKKINSLKLAFVHATLAFGLVAACENAHVLNSRSASSQRDAVDSEGRFDQDAAGKSDPANDELFNLELHKDKVAENITVYTKHKKPKEPCAPSASPELPVVSPGAPGMTVGQVSTTLVFVCSKTPDELKALWTFVQSLTPDQVANLSKFDPMMGAQMQRLQSIVKLVPIETILGLKLLFCPATSAPAVPSPGTDTATGTGTGSGTSTGTSTSTGTGTSTLKVSDKATANLP